MEPDIAPESPKKPSRTRKARVVPIRIEKPKRVRKSPKIDLVPDAQISAPEVVVKKPRARKPKKTEVAFGADKAPSETVVNAVSVSKSPIAHSLKQRKVFLAVNTIAIAIIGLASWSVYAKPTELPVSQTMPALEESVFLGEVSSSTPETLSIPSIGVTAHVVPVGLTKDGNMNVPADFENVGWYKYGPIPGRVGNAVIDGHFDNGKGDGAVFYELSRVRVGDSVFVTNKVGERIQFRVKEVRLVNLDDLPSDLIFGETDSMNLNLITCDGVWLPDRRTYTERLVVFTERVVQ